MKALDILLRVWYAESMKVEFTEQELVVIAYGLEDHITNLNKNIQALGDMFESTCPGMDGMDSLLDLRTAYMRARTKTRRLLAKVEHFIGKDY